jgi:hypothetical protein
VFAGLFKLEEGVLGLAFTGFELREELFELVLIG